MSAPEPPNGIRWRVEVLERRVDKLYDLEPAVLANEVHNLGDDVRSLKRAFYTFAFSAVVSAVVFAFSVFALLGPR